MTICERPERPVKAVLLCRIKTYACLVDSSPLLRRRATLGQLRRNHFEAWQSQAYELLLDDADPPACRPVHQGKQGRCRSHRSRACRGRRGTTQRGRRSSDRGAPQENFWQRWRRGHTPSKPRAIDRRSRRLRWRRRRCRCCWRKRQPQPRWWWWRWDRTPSKPRATDRRSKWRRRWRRRRCCRCCFKGSREQYQTWALVH